MTPNFRDFLIILIGAVIFSAITLFCSGCAEMTEQERWEFEQRRVAEIIACNREPPCFVLSNRLPCKQYDVRYCRSSMEVLIR